ncbi:FIST signal transduction protein [Pseudoalteromonas sp. MQS005]|uniref:FIST signal transduction protein n=1 Tax=Pseudoalteromonas sp. MQS005 TaxID=1854052 RepID=UPI0007E4F060|nr:FIST N-terminal domain-containing protein [Pseudoalteromonas sp. MQS005]
MFAIDTFHTHGRNIDEFIQPISQFVDNAPDLLLGFATTDTIKYLYNNQPGFLKNTQNCLIISSCLGSATEQNLSLNEQSISLFSIKDSRGHYGIASCNTTNNLREKAHQTVLKAIANAGQTGLAPKMVWCFQVPGNEELVLQGIQDAIGQRIPVFGGSCADNDISAKWCFSDTENVYQQGFIIAVLYPCVETFGFYSSGYDKTDQQGTVTDVDGRLLKTIDNLPAFDVYNQWRQNLGLEQLTAGNILAQSTMTPLARALSLNDEIPRLLLSHPAVAKNGTLELFSNLSVGDTIYLASGSPEQLIKRGDMVVTSLTKLAELHAIKNITGAIIIFCGGCMLSIKDAMQEVKESIETQLPNTPFIMGFTFGELGTFSDSTSKHGNLMISCEIFGGPE